MKIDNRRPASLLDMSRKEDEERKAPAADALIQRRSLSPRPLKDYPQSLQTAARALWG